MTDEARAREELAYFMRRLYERGLTTSTGGNASTLVGGGRMLITPSGADKGSLEPSDIVEIGPEGLKACAGAEPSMESGLHMCIYAARGDIRAILHAHPPFVTALSATGLRVRTDLVAETRAVIGEPADVPYALMGGEALARSAGDAAGGSDVIVLRNHGAAALGASLAEAFVRMEVLEAAARATFMTRLLGDVRPLTATDLAEIDRLFGR